MSYGWFRWNHPRRAAYRPKPSNEFIVAFIHSTAPLLALKVHQESCLRFMASVDDSASKSGINAEFQICEQLRVRPRE